MQTTIGLKKIIYIGKFYIRIYFYIYYFNIIILYILTIRLPGGTTVVTGKNDKVVERLPRRKNY